MPSPVGEGVSRRLTDEAPDKIQFFAKRKSSKTYPIKYSALHSECKRIQHEGFLHCQWLRRLRTAGAERNTSLHSGSIDSVQNAEEELRHFEALVAKAEAFALVRGAASGSV